MPEREMPLSEFSFFEPDEQERFSKLTNFSVAQKILESPGQAVYALYELWRTGKESQIYSVANVIRFQFGRNPWDYFSANAMSEAVSGLLLEGEQESCTAAFISSSLVLAERGSRGWPDNEDLEPDRMKMLAEFGQRIMRDSRLKKEVKILEKKTDRWASHWREN